MGSLLRRRRHRKRTMKAMCRFKMMRRPGERKPTRYVASLEDAHWAGMKADVARVVSQNDAEQDLMMKVSVMVFRLKKEETSNLRGTRHSWSPLLP